MADQTSKMMEKYITTVKLNKKLKQKTKKYSSYLLLIKRFIKINILISTITVRYLPYYTFFILNILKRQMYLSNFDVW